MDIRHVGVNNQPKFGMAITTTEKAAKMLEENLTKKGAKRMSKLIAAEKNNPENVNIQTSIGYLSKASIPSEYWTPYDKFEVQVRDKKFYNNGWLEMFSPSKAIVNTVKRAVNYARKIANNKEGLKDLIKA